MRAKQSLGQNFLMHARIAERIARTAPLRAHEAVLEIGPGTGILTKELLKLGRQVIAIEADGELFETLQGTFASDIASGKLTLVHGDIRALDFSSLPEQYAVVANIPYYLTGEIFRMFLEALHQPSSMTLLVQKEVAERVGRSKKESILSISVKAYGIPKYEFTVPRGAFMPAPKVDSAVLTISDISRKNFNSREQERRFFALVHAGFAHKRKFVRKNLIDAGFDAGEISQNTASSGQVLPGIAEKARAEDLSLAAWLALVA